MNNKIKDRIFLIGCPRSGTTLLQSLLAANSHIFSFPETHLFEYLFYNKKLLSILGIANWRARSRWNRFLAEIGHREMQTRLPKFSILVRQFSRTYIDVLDMLTVDEKKTVWVEKTPGHLHFVEQIEKLVKDVKFVHIIRNGVDVIASLYEVTRNYPEVWGGTGWSIEECILRWRQDMQLSRMYSTRKNHALISYEDLVAEPSSVLVNLCNFINVPFEEKMLLNYSIVSKQVVLDNEPWKAMTNQPIQSTHGAKFQSLFDKEQQQYIIERLSEYLPQMNAEAGGEGAHSGN